MGLPLFSPNYIESLYINHSTVWFQYFHNHHRLFFSSILCGAFLNYRKNQRYFFCKRTPGPYCYSVGVNQYFYAYRWLIIDFTLVVLYVFQMDSSNCSRTRRANYLFLIGIVSVLGLYGPLLLCVWSFFKTTEKTKNYAS